MRVTMLMENRAHRPEYACGHGLSMLIGIGDRTILFDAGPDAGYAQNARALGVDLAAVDAAVLSHGHNDHGDGFVDFLARNPTAPLYVSRDALGRYYAIEEDGSEAWAGVDRALAGSPRLVYNDGEAELFPGALLFTLPAAMPRRLVPKVNDVLYRRTEAGDLPDDFAHEQNLLLREGDISALFSGCAHSGILNILERAEQLNGGELDAVLGGFHLQDPDSLRTEEAGPLAELAAALARRKKTRYYAFHCTGEGPFRLLEKRLGGRVEWLAAGRRLSL